MGSEHWIEQLEKLTGKARKPQKRGPETSAHDDK
ncbi:MAG: hypothetical protein N838_24925 [Thiohalocapsa sp. PB-PSB1]|nr:MAG: hypothetical protein N838_24925 [Thiohalocapsa sp. PB-PSB1]